MKNFLKKYKSLGIITAGLIFNLITSIMFAAEGVPFNKSPLTVGEWICDIISILVILFGTMKMIYDMWTYKPMKTTTYKRLNGEIVEVIVNN